MKHFLGDTTKNNEVEEEEMDLDEDGEYDEEIERSPETPTKKRKQVRPAELLTFALLTKVSSFDVDIFTQILILFISMS